MAKNRSGFTLIELMVVVGVVSTLTALLLPALSKARESGRKALCSSNLHQLGLAMTMYLDDYGRFFPYYTDIGADRLWYFGLETPYSPGAAPGDRKLNLSQGTLSPYLKSTRGVQVCPSYDYHSPKWRQKFDSVTFGYGYNAYGLISNGLGKTTSSLPNLSRIVCFADAANVNTIQPPASSGNPMLEEFYYVHPFNNQVPTTHFRHAGRANVLYCDGHLESASPAPGTIDTRMPRAMVGRINADGDMSLFW